MGARLAALAVTALLFLGCAAGTTTPTHSGAKAPVTGELEAGSVFDPTKTVEVVCCIMEHRTYLHLKPYTAEEIAERFDVTLATEPVSPRVGEPAILDVRIVDKTSTGGGLLGSQPEIRAHFNIVSENREELQHFHVMDLGEDWQGMALDGHYKVPVTFSMGGRYWVIVDFVDRNRPVHISFPVEVEGPVQPPTRWDTAQKKSKDGYDYLFALTPTTPRQKRLLNMTVRVERDGAGVETLEKRHGALAHVTLVPPSDAGKTRHLHGGGGEFGHYRFWKSSPGYAGPRLYFNDILTAPGKYRVKLEFQHEGAVREVVFDFEAATQDRGAP